MGNTQNTENEQAKLWNGAAGRGWVEAQDLLDALFLPLEQLLANHAAESGAANVLDIGCGTGATTVAVARRLGASAACTGVDISAPMIEAARARAERENLPATFVCADAEAHPFAPARFDRIVSRFGVMFFADSVRAFRNLRSAAGPNAQLQVIAWRSPAENAFMTTAERAAAPLLPDIPPRRTDGPGQFAFADREKVQGILAASGWANIAVEPLDVACSFPARVLDVYLTRIGPLAQLLPELNAGLRDRVLATVRAAFAPYRDGDLIRFTASCWRIEAAAGSQ